MPRHGRYGAMNNAAYGAMRGMGGGGSEWLDDGTGSIPGGGGYGAMDDYDTNGAVPPDSLGNNMEIGMSGDSQPSFPEQGIGPDYEMNGGTGQYDGAMNRRPRRRPGNPYLNDQ